MTDLFNPQALQVFIGIFLTALGGYVVVVINNRKLISERHAHQNDLESQLKVLRLESDIAEMRRSELLRTETEQIRKETSLQQRVLADNLSKSSKEQRDAMEYQNRILASISTTADKTHELTNSAKTAMDITIADLRSQLRAAETAYASLKETYVIEQQSLKDVFVKDIQLIKEENRQLSEQLKTSLLHAVPPTVG